MKIGVFDSGKGGTTVLESIKRKLPYEEYFYIADSDHFPYGEKTDGELFTIVDSVVKSLLRQGSEIIVVACNTATTRCIKHLREAFPDVKFVGTEPAVHLAVKQNANKILVLATPGTAKSERLLLMIKKLEAGGRQIDVLACPGLADAIEKNNHVDEVLHGLLDSITKDYDAVVLGCTHYSLIKDKIQKFFPNSKLVDGNEGVANRVFELVNS